MFKLIILIEPDIDEGAFFEGFPQFLAHAENLPGLERVVTAPVQTCLAGKFSPLMIYELIFPTRQALESAMASEEGVAAGKTLQIITRGAVTLLVSAHMEDSAENLRSYHNQRPSTSKG
ncbi:MAG: hypothetical protein PVI99_00460 [Anaerolineales bacterium]|jgi:hypothetical protein